MFRTTRSLSKDRLNGPSTERFEVRAKPLLLDDSLHSSVYSKTISVATNRHVMNSGINSHLCSSVFSSSMASQQSLLLLTNPAVQQSRQGHFHETKSPTKGSIKGPSSGDQRKSTPIDNFITPQRDGLKLVAQPSTQKSLPIIFRRNEQLLKSREEAIEELLIKYRQTPLIRGYIQFSTNNWPQLYSQLLTDKKLQSLLSSVIHHNQSLTQILDEFMLDQVAFTPSQSKLMASVLLKQLLSSVRSLQQLAQEMHTKIPQERLYRQEKEMESLQDRLLLIYDPKQTPSVQERLKTFHDQYSLRKNNLEAEVCHKLKKNFLFLTEVENYLANSQQQISKLQMQISILAKQKSSLEAMLERKEHFSHVSVDLAKLGEMREAQRQRLLEQLEQNYVKFHQQRHEAQSKAIAALIAEKDALVEQLDLKTAKIEQLQLKFEELVLNQPKKVSIATQICLIDREKGTEQLALGSIYSQFLSSAVTPFTFSETMTAAFINLLVTDRILYDFEIIRSRQALHSMQHFVFEWFTIRSGCKRFAQIYVKNFVFSLQELKGRHKRFNMFLKMTGFSQLRKKSLRQDLQTIFYQTHLCWYYFLRIALIYRRKMNEEPTGYQILPPLSCQEIFKLPLRKIYEIAEQFLIVQEIPVPPGLQQKIDCYAINEISRFKQHDENFQKQQLQEIHILRQLNFDILTGFLIDLIATSHCERVESLLRAVHFRQQQIKAPVGFSDFEVIYKRFLRDKRHKIELVYSKLCLCNPLDVLNAENMFAVVVQMLEDEGPLRSSFDKIEDLKMLIVSEKTNIKTDKRQVSPNSFDAFKERYYHEFYDFYNTSNVLFDLFKIVKGLIKKKTKRAQRKLKPKTPAEPIEAAAPTSSKANSVVGSQKVGSKSDEANLILPSSVDSSLTPHNDPDEEDSEDEMGETPLGGTRNQNRRKFYVEPGSDLESKIEDWNKAVAKLPHFTTKVLTIEQIVIHTMRRKEMIEVSEFAWRVLRDVFALVDRV